MAIRSFLKAIQSADHPEVERPHHDSPAAEPPIHDESNWLVSFADMMTLLCGFFIMLFSMAKLDAPQYELVKESVSKAFGGEYQSPASDLAKFVTKILEEAGIEKDATVKVDQYGVSVVFQSTIFFDTLSADITPGGKVILYKLIDGVYTRQSKENKKYKIVVEGHTDSRPITGGLFPSNWELAGARAARVIRMYLERGFDPDKLSAISYADTRPEVPARTPSGEWDEAALAKNRRVVIRILDPRQDIVPIAETANKVTDEKPVHEAVAPAAAPPAITSH
jgi:chemotaxis protein MotB